MKIFKPLFAIRKRIPTSAYLRQRLAHLRSPVCLPWFKMRGKQDTVNRIHRLALEINRSRIRGGMVKGILVWPIVSLLLALYAVYRYGIHVEKRYRISLWLQWKRIVYLANVFNLPPQSYYDFRLWNDSNLRRVIN